MDLFTESWFCDHGKAKSSWLKFNLKCSPGCTPSNLSLVSGNTSHWPAGPGLLQCTGIPAVETPSCLFLRTHQESCTDLLQELTSQEQEGEYLVIWQLQSSKNLFLKKKKSRGAETKEKQGQSRLGTSTRCSNWSPTPHPLVSLTPHAVRELALLFLLFGRSQNSWTIRGVTLVSSFDFIPC